MSHLSRRKFIRGAAAASAAFPLFTIAGTKASGKVIGANDTVRIGVAGSGGRGGEHIEPWTSAEKVQITYLIDPDKTKSADQDQAVEKGSKTRPRRCKTSARPRRQGARRRLGRDLQPLALADHDLGLPGGQGRLCREADQPQHLRRAQVRRSGTKVQPRRPARHAEPQQPVLGQTRSRRCNRASIGKLLVSRGQCEQAGGKGRASIGYRPITTPPSDLDFNIWLGPAPMQPFHENLLHYNWHWFWDTGNGEIGNQGVHQMDIARWGIKAGNLPTKVYSLGGRFLHDGPDQAQTPNMQMAVMEFGNGGPIFCSKSAG